MSRVVMCVVPDRSQAELIVGHLQETGFSTNAISVLFADRREARDSGRLTEAGTIGRLAHVETLTLPGVGPLVAAGALFTGLGATAEQVGVESLASALVTLGVPELDARRYDGRIKAGGLLLAVRTTGSEAAWRAARIFRSTRALAVSSTTSADEPMWW